MSRAKLTLLALVGARDHRRPSLCIDDGRALRDDSFLLRTTAGSTLARVRIFHPLPLIPHPPTYVALIAEKGVNCEGGTFLTGDISLTITAATGIYASFFGGHNHMVDMLHILADGTQVEHCYCIISRPT